MPEGLVLDRVAAGYPRRPVLEGVTMRVPRGEVVGLIGPNGSGKTTLVRVASRVLRPASGRVEVEGSDLFGIPSRRAARLVAVVPQETAPVFSFTALEVVLMGRAPYLSAWGGGGAEDYRRAREAMETAGVQALADRPLEELSGGEKQRVVLAQALAQDAPVLLLDEPTTHLDPGHLVSILEAVRSLARNGRAVLAVFHDLNLAASTCDRLVVIDRGRIVTEGAPGDVLTAGLLADVYGVEADVLPAASSGRPVVILGPAPGERGPTRGGRVHVIGGAGRGARLMRELAEAGFEVTAGVLHLTDTDADVAERLNLERVVVPPFSHVDQRAEADALALAAEAVAIVVCDAPYGPGNLGNLRVAMRAGEGGVRVVLVDADPVERRDFTGGEAARLWHELASGGTVVRSGDDAIGVLTSTEGWPGEA